MDSGSFNYAVMLTYLPLFHCDAMTHIEFDLFIAFNILKIMCSGQFVLYTVLDAALQDSENIARN